MTSTPKSQRRVAAAIFFCVSLCLWLATALAQAPGIEGNWYGTITAPGATFEIAVNFQRKGDGWTGSLLMENGDTMPLSQIVIKAEAISFSIDSGAKSITFLGSFSSLGPEISGEFKQDDSTFPFQLNRTPSAAFQGGMTAIDPNELIAMMTSFSGPASDRPFVPPLTYPAIGYGVRPTQDAVAKLQRDIQDGSVQLKFEGKDGYLRSLLDALKISVESQMAVFSKNSLQSPMISPENPRMLFFNDSVSVGSVRGGFIELAAQDPEQGVTFYMLPQQAMDKPFIIRRDDCLRCHLSRNSMDIPGMLLRSVYPSADGTPINPLGSYLLDHRTKFEERWGGWYVTGNSASLHHIGNAVVTDPAKSESMMLLNNPVQSDIVALLVFEHQMHMTNLITRTGWEFRVAANLEDATGKPNEAIDKQLRETVNELVDYLLFVDEAPLSGKIQGTSGFAEKFAAQGPFDSKGRSLRQFDLEHRLMRYPCSYMIYSPAFDALPAKAKTQIYSRMIEVMPSRLAAADRQAVVEILRETKELPDNFK